MALTSPRCAIVNSVNLFVILSRCFNLPFSAKTTSLNNMNQISIQFIGDPEVRQDLVSQSEKHTVNLENTYYHLSTKN